jgi:hypothetical protein
VCSWQSSCLLGGVCRAIRLLKSFICDGFGSDQSFFFQECSACSRLRSNWVAIEFFFFPLSFLSHALEIHDNPFKKQLCPLICNFIDFDPYYFNYYLFWFSCFWSFAFFFQFHPWVFYSTWFYIQVGPLTFDCSCSVFYIFFLLLFLILSITISLHLFFLIQFWSSFFWLLFFFILFLIYLFFSSTFYFFLFFIQFWSSFFQLYFLSFFNLFCFSN